MTDDEIIETMFNEVKTVSVQTSGGKRLVSDEETVREMEFTEAREAFVTAETKWAKLDARASALWAHPASDPRDLCNWFDALEARYQADKRLWELFTGKDRGPKSNRMYCEYRRALLSGRSLRADA